MIAKLGYKSVENLLLINAFSLFTQVKGLLLKITSTPSLKVATSEIPNLDFQKKLVSIILSSSGDHMILCSAQNYPLSMAYLIE